VRGIVRSNAKPAPTPTKTKSATRAKSVAASVLSQAKPGRATTGAFAVTLGPQTLKTLSSRKANVKALMEVLGDTIDKSRKSADDVPSLRTVLRRAYDRRASIPS
jgi:hypothetical protein